MTLVLVHGAGEDHHVWDPWCALLAPYPVLAIDLPGRLDVPGPALTTVADAARFVADLTAARGVDRFVVAGHSYGSAIALELALTFPERVSGLVLASSGARLRVHPAIYEALSEGRDPAQNGAPWSKQMPIETAIADWHAVGGFDRLGQPLGVRAPTLVVVGELDPLTPPKYARYLVEHIAGAELVLVPNAGHEVPFEQAETVVAHVRKLLTPAVSGRGAA